MANAGWAPVLLFDHGRPAALCHQTTRVVAAAACAVVAVSPRWPGDARAGRTDLAREDRLTNLSRGLLTLTLGLQWVLFSALLWWPEGTARALGAPAPRAVCAGQLGGVWRRRADLPAQVYLRVPLTPLPWCSSCCSRR